MLTRLLSYSLLLLTFALCQSPPVITGIPNPYYVKEHTKFTLDCSRYTQSPQPVTNYTWSNNDGFAVKDPVLYLWNIDRSWSGHFTCSAGYKLTPISLTVTGTARVTLDVQYAPRIDLPDIYSLTEYSTLQMNCNDYIRPGNPNVTSSRWSRDGVDITSDAILTIPNITRDSPRGYKCTATNTMTPTGGSPVTGTGSDYTWLEVEHGPDNRISISPASAMEREEGSGSLTITCKAACKPICQFTWAKENNETYVESNKLHIGDLRTDDQGNYTCEARNRIGVSRKTFSLMVHERSKGSSEVTSTSGQDSRRDLQPIPICLIGAVAGSIICVLVVMVTCAIIFYMKGYRCTRVITKGNNGSPTKDKFSEFEKDVLWKDLKTEKIQHPQNKSIKEPLA